MSQDERRAYGTADLDAPVTRRDLERALRGVNVTHLELRDALLKIGARVVALTDELTRRIDGVEPRPAPEGTAAPAPTATVEDAVEGAMQRTLEHVRAADSGTARIALDLREESKYEVEPVDIPCHELIPLCHARCCALTFSLSTADLDEGIIRWDYGQPYLIRQRKSDGFCVHNDPDTRGCTVHHARPRTCREFDCRKDKRIWTDYEQRIAAPYTEYQPPKTEPSAFDLLERARARAVAVWRESAAINQTFSDDGPLLGPAPKPRG